MDKEGADRSGTRYQEPGLKLVTEENTGIFKCKGRIPGYQPTYIEGGVFADKLIRHIHEDTKHLGVPSTT